MLLWAVAVLLDQPGWTEVWQAGSAAPPHPAAAAAAAARGTRTPFPAPWRIFVVSSVPITIKGIWGIKKSDKVRCPSTTKLPHFPTMCLSYPDMVTVLHRPIIVTVLLFRYLEYLKIDFNRAQQEYIGKMQCSYICTNTKCP